MRSIGLKLTLAVTVLLVMTIGLLMLANTVFLRAYYIHLTKKAFSAAYAEVAKEYSGKSERSLQFLRDLNKRNGYKFSVADADRRIILSSTPEFKLGHDLGLPGGEADLLRRSEPVLRRGEVIFRILRDPLGQQESLQLAAALGERDFLLITQPLRQLNDNARIANNFLLAIGGVLLVLAILAAFIMSRALVRPILDLTRIAGSIATLDFSPRYTGVSRDEIGRLGASINTLAERLDAALEAQRRVNERLQKEMQLQKRFLASVSHEFKTPVGLIRGYAESLQLELVKTPEERREAAGIMIKEADRLNRLVNDLLMLVRLEVGEFQMRMVPLDLARVLQETTGAFALQAAKKEVELALDLPGVLPVMADEERIAQAVQNLMANSLRHVNKKGRILLRAEVTGGMIRVELSNTGSRIEQDHLAHLFEPFYRTEDARSRKSGGTGLGLSIVRGIVAAHNGRCGTENIGQGAMFWFELPL